MKKFELEHLQTRVNKVLQCVSGTVITKLEKEKQAAVLTNADKWRMIKNHTAILRDMHDLIDAGKSYESRYTVLLSSYTYTENDETIAVNKHNTIIEDRKQSILQDIQLAGNRLIDSVVLGLIKTENIPEELATLGNLADIYL